MQHLLGLLQRADPVVVSHDWRQRFGTAEIQSLWRPHSCLEFIPCHYCHTPHGIQAIAALNRYFYTCPHAKVTRFLSAESFLRWRLDVHQLLLHVSLQLGVKPDIEPLEVPAVWRLGRLTIQGAEAVVECWLCRRLTTASLVWLINQNFRCSRVLLTLGGLLLPQRVAFRYIDLQQLIRDPIRLHMDRQFFQQWIQRQFQRILFDQDNGDLWADGTRVVTATPASPQFFFLACLWEQFNQPVSHEDIFAYCIQKLAQRDGVSQWQSQYLPSEFCHAKRAVLLRKALNPSLCAQLVKATKTHDEQNAYRLTTPDR